MAFNLSIPAIKADLASAINSLEVIKLNYQSRKVIYGLLSNQSESFNINDAIKKLGLTSTILVESLPLLIAEVKTIPDYQSKIEQDNNFLFKLLVVKAINHIIEKYRQEFFKLTDAEREEIIQQQIDLEKENEDKFNKQTTQLRELENKKLENLLITLALLQAMKQQYLELQQRENELTIELKKNISSLIGKIFTTADGKSISKEAQDIIAHRVIDFQKDKFLEIRAEIINNLDQHNGRQYEPGKVLPDANDIDSKVFNSLKWKAANENGVANIVRAVYSEQGLQQDESMLSIQVKEFIEEEEPALKEVFKEVAAGRDAEEVIKENYLERAEIVNSMQESQDFSVDFDFLDLNDEPASLENR